MGKLRELEGEGEIDELEGFHGSGLVQVVGVEDDLGLLSGGAVDVEVGEEGFHLGEGEVALALDVGGGEQVESEAHEQEGRNEVVVLEVARVSRIGERLEGLEGASSQGGVAETDEHVSKLSSGSMTIRRLGVEKRNSVHQHIVEPHEGTKGNHSLAGNVKDGRRVRQDLGRETSETKLGQNSGEFVGLAIGGAEMS